MSENIIQIPRTVEAKEFYSDKLADALENSRKAGAVLYMPEIIGARIYATGDAPVWHTWYSSPSIRATGKTKQGNPVVVYAHIPNHFSDPKNIRAAIEQGLSNGAGIIPNEEFQRLLDMEDGENVFVVNYNALKSSESGVIKLSKALAHPQTIPFCGGKERADKYLEGCIKAYNTNKIGNWHSDDLADEPRGRLLRAGISHYYGLDGNINLDDVGRFLAVSENQAKSGPGMEQIIKLSKNYVLQAAQESFERGIVALYRK